MCTQNCNNNCINMCAVNKQVKVVQFIHPGGEHQPSVRNIKNGKVIPSLAAGFPICGYTFIEDDETVSRISKMVDDYRD